MRLTRRDFVSGGGAAAVAILASEPVDAGMNHGTVPVYPSARNLVSEGDSITDSAVAAGSGYATACSNLASPSFATFSNKALTGSTLASMTTRAAACDAAIVPGDANILSVFIGANDLAGSGDSSAFLSSLASYCDARRSAGWYVILCTLLPKGVSPNTFLTNRAIVNTELRLWTVNGSSVPGNHCDRICDFAADPVMGIDAGSQNATYFAGDNIHPTLAGQARLRDMLRPVLDASMRNGGSNPTIQISSYECEVGSADLTIDLRADRGVVWSISGAAELSLNELYQLKLSASTLGAYATSLTATDGNGRTSTLTFTWTVSAPPNLYGPNLLKNPKANNGLNAWGGTLSLWFTSSSPLLAVDDGAGGKEFQITGTGGSFPQAGQAVTLINGQTYKVDGVYRKGTGQNAAVQANGSTSSTTNSANTAFTASFVASGTSTNIIMLINNAAAAGTAFFDDLAIRQLL